MLVKANIIWQSFKCHLVTTHIPFGWIVLSTSSFNYKSFWNHADWRQKHRFPLWISNGKKKKLIGLKLFKRCINKFNIWNQVKGLTRMFVFQNHQPSNQFASLHIQEYLNLVHKCLLLSQKTHLWHIRESYIKGIFWLRVNFPLLFSHAIRLIWPIEATSLNIHLNIIRKPLSRRNIYQLPLYCSNLPPSWCRYM